MHSATTPNRSTSPASSPPPATIGWFAGRERMVDLVKIRKKAKKAVASSESRVAGAPPEVAGDESRVAGASLEVAGDESRVAGAPPEVASDESRVAGASQVEKRPL